MLKNENAFGFAKRIDSEEDNHNFLEGEEFDEVLGLLAGIDGWSGIIHRLKERGYSEFKIGYCIGELKHMVDRKD